MQWYKKALVVPSILFLSSCDKIESVLPIQPPEAGELSTFHIAKGKHESMKDFQLFDGYSLKFKVRFDETAMYTTKAKENQADINKLYGFSDCGTHHHENSARIGWRWYNQQLELHAYAYVDGKRKTEFIKAIPFDSFVECEIAVLDNEFLFRVGDKEVKITRACTLDPGGYRLYPYFGGDEVAPHDINIDIQEM